jgi:hypothetical protein
VFGGGFRSLSRLPLPFSPDYREMRYSAGLADKQLEFTPRQSP